MSSKDQHSQSTSSPEDSPASLFPQLERDLETQTTAHSGEKCLELYSYSSRAGSSLRMFVEYLVSKTDWYSSKCALIWKTQDTKCSRLLFLLSPRMRTTDEIECGSAPDMCPTPDVRGFTNDGSLQMLAKYSGDREEWSRMAYRAGSKQKEKLWPTVAARDHKGGRTPEALQAAGRSERNSLPDAVNHENGETGSLNPQWVEWLMGYPAGWTDLED